MAPSGTESAITGDRRDDETLKQLDEIWPGTGGETPEAYAW